MSSACPRWDDRQRLPRCPLCCRGGQPGPATHLQFVQAAVKMENAPDLSLRGPNGAVAISGRHLQPVQAAVKTVCAEVWGVAAVTAQPLAALPPYGCGVPLAGSERHADWHFLRYAFCGARPPDLSLRGGRRPTWRPERAARGSALGVQSRKALTISPIAFPRCSRVLRDSHVASLLGMTNLEACQISAIFSKTRKLILDFFSIYVTI